MTISVEGRNIIISRKAAYMHEKMCNLPIDDVTVEMYLEFFLGQRYKEVLKTLPDADLTQIVENGVWNEFCDLCGEEAWHRELERAGLENSERITLLGT